MIFTVIDRLLWNQIQNVMSVWKVNIKSNHGQHQQFLCIENKQTSIAIANVNVNVNNEHI